MQCSTVQYSTVQYSTVRSINMGVSTHRDQCTLVGSIYRDAHVLELDNRACLSTVQYSTVHYSTVQYSTVQYCTVQCSTDLLKCKQVHTGISAL